MTMTCAEVRDQAAGFVLGALTPADEQAVREHLATCPEAHEEFAELGGVVPALAESVESVEPPPALRGRIMAAAADDLRARRAAATTPTTSAAATSAAVSVDADVRAAAPIVRFPSGRARSRAPRFAWALGIAAALVIAALGAWNVRLQAQLSDAQAYQAQVDQVFAIARTPGGSIAVLTSPSAGGQDGVVAIGADGRAAMVVKGLAQASGRAVYEVWVITGSNDPVPVGALTQSGGVAFMAGTPGPVPAGSVVALTMEPGPNPTHPTLPILVKGVLGATS